MRHVVIAALNFLHGGIHLDQIHLLGRRPNAVHLRVHQRLWALLATCETPGLESFSLVPGRSGPEFIARLHELETFIEENGILPIDSYAEGPEDLEKQKVGEAQPKEDSLPVKPYSQLNSARLKLVGRGAWDLAKHLHDELWLPYKEPKILQHGQPLDYGLGPDLSREDRAENLALAQKWGSQSLLVLVREPPIQETFTRIFNAHKSQEHDRQIGDRRLANRAERHLTGPSKALPIGYMITGIHVPPGCLAKGSITDRKDFYHQAMASRARAQTNVLPFAFSEDDFTGSEALLELHEFEAQSRSRDFAGDNFRHQPRAVLRAADRPVYAAFGSLLQGDHLGVEFALSAHASLLQDFGLLRSDERIEGGKAFPLGPSYQGLVIDDFFCIAVERPGLPPRESKAVQCFDRAIEAYESEEVLGSKEKDIVGSCHFKVVGAEVNSSESARSKGVVTVAAPVQKRVSLAVLSLRAAQLPVISASLASRLAGNWTSVLLYRRCLTCILDRIYGFATRENVQQKDVFEFPREAANELALASVLGFLATSDVSVDFLPRVFATDASLHKGAVVGCEAPREVSKILWLGGDRRGCHTMLDAPFRQAARICDLYQDDSELQQPPGPVQISKGLDFSFDFVEVCGGKAETSSFLSSWGYSVMPPIELSDSKHFDLRDLKVYEWLCNMLKSKKLRSIMLEPVCATFSPAAHPAVRSYANPKGFNRKCPKTLLGNIIAFRCLGLAWYAALQGAIVLLEQPPLSKMCWLPLWKFLVRCKNFSEAVCASCQFGSIHRKEFRLLLSGIPSDELDVRRPGGHEHVPIGGAYTKPSAVYVSALAKFFAEAFARALRRQSHFAEDEPKIEGIQSVLANDLLLTANWELEFQRRWKHASHINMLESHAFLALLRKRALNGGDERFVALLDSRVAKGCHARGRSSARALKPSLKKAAAIQVAYGLYPAFGFAPTKLNVADDPTRDQPLRSAWTSSIIPLHSKQRLASTHAIGLSPFAARWVRLVLLASLLQPTASASTESALPHLSLGFAIGRSVCWIFCILLGLFGLSILLHLRSCRRSLTILFLLPASWIKFGVRVTASHEPQLLPLALMFSSCHGVPLGPLTAEERGRAERRAQIHLQAD